jgi:hypothetical protein
MNTGCCYYSCFQIKFTVAGWQSLWKWAQLLLIIIKCQHQMTKINKEKYASINMSTLLNK